MGLLSSEPTLWEEVWAYLLYRYFDPDLPYFYNLSNRLDAKSIVIVIAAVFLGVILSGFFFVIYMKSLGDFPRRLAELGAFDEASAVVPSKSGVKMPLLLRFALRNPSCALRRYIRYVGQVDQTYEEASKKGQKKVRAPRTPAPDLQNLPIYLVRDRSDECLHRFSKEGNGYKPVFILIGVLIPLFFVVCRFLPDILSLVDSFLGVGK